MKGCGGEFDHSLTPRIRRSRFVTKHAHVTLRVSNVDINSVFRSSKAFRQI